MVYPYDFSVMMITFNHEKFLSQAIESILSQEFDKKFEIVVGVDKSSDSTLEICYRYQAKFPSIIRLLVHSENVGMYQNFIGTLKSCRGKYIAILEGDDYWTDNKKLQTQYSFLEKNPDCVLTAGLSSQLREAEEQFSRPFFSLFSKGKPFTKADLVYSNRLTTLTTAFRLDAICWTELDKLQGAPHLDWGLYLSLQYGDKGFAYRFNRKFGVYRMHSGGVYSLVDDEKRNINFLKTVQAMSGLQLKPSEHQYLKALFVNFALRLKSGGLDIPKSFVEYCDAGLIIYQSKNKFTNEYIKEIYKKLLSMRGWPRKEFVRTNFELIRQTKRSNMVYANLYLLPFFVMACFLKVSINLKKYSLVKS